MIRKISILVLFVFITSLITIAQDTQPTNQVDTKGLKQGPWEKYDQKGNLIYTGTFKDDKPVGLFKRFNQNGILKAEMLYKEKSEKVYSKFYYPDMSLQAEGNYIGKLKDSLWIFYSADGFKINEVVFQNNKKNGTEKKFFQSGNLSEKSEWENDINNGLTIRYYESGKIMMRILYENGQLNGEYNVFNSEEKIIIQGQYKNNKREGKWIYYKENGHVKDELNYINGIAENQEELERLENEQIEILMKNKGKFQDPMESMYNSVPPSN